MYARARADTGSAGLIIAIKSGHKAECAGGKLEYNFHPAEMFIVYTGGRAGV